MKIHDAVQAVEEQRENIDELEGTYLCSALAFADDKDNATIATWELSYYHPKQKKITQVSVTDEEVTMQAKGDPTKAGEIHELSVASVKISAEDALANARTIQKAKYMQPVQRIFISLQTEDKKTLWSVTFISKLMSIVNIKIDAKTGDVLDSSLKSFLHGKSSAQ